MAQEKILGRQLNIADCAAELNPALTTDLVTDTSPQLGADLDTNTYDIVMRSGGTDDKIRFVYDPDGGNTEQGSLYTGGSGTGELFVESQGTLWIRGTCLLYTSPSPRDLNQYLV